MSTNPTPFTGANKDEPNGLIPGYIEYSFTYSGQSIPFNSFLYSLSGAINVGSIGITKTYDSKITLPILSPNNFTGSYNNDLLNIVATGANYASSNVGYGLAISGTFQLGNPTAYHYYADVEVTVYGYLITSIVLDGNITPANLTATGSHIYNGETKFNASNLLVLGVNNQNFKASGTLTLASPNVQTNQNPIYINIILTEIGNGLLSNYNSLINTQVFYSITQQIGGINLITTNIIVNTCINKFLIIVIPLQYSTLDIIVVKKPVHGILKKCLNNKFKYIPNQDYKGEDFFTYKSTFPYSQVFSNISTVFIDIE